MEQENLIISDHYSRLYQNLSPEQRKKERQFQVYASQNALDHYFKQIMSFDTSHIETFWREEKSKKCIP